MSKGALPSAANVVAFWQGAGPATWFAKDEAFDRAIAKRFGALHAEAASGGLADWEATPEGALALILVLDQFSRNLHRGSPAMFAQDVRAVGVASRAIARGLDAEVDPALRAFIGMPFMHSERIADQEDCVRYMHAYAPGNLKYAREHRDIVRRFGRFPHRNGTLGRGTSDAEHKFLSSGGFSG